MIAAAVALTVAYAAAAALLLHLNLRTRLPMWVKSAALLVVTALYFGAWQAQRALLGWATPESLPDDFRLQWLTVEEPDKATGEDGSIYFWVRGLDAAGLPVGPPRAHWVAWDEATAEAAQEALAQLQDGQPLNGTFTRQGIVTPADPAGAAARAGAARDSTTNAARGQFEFRRVPRPALPAKPAPSV